MSAELGVVDNETHGAWLKQVSEAVKKNSFVKRGASKQSLKTRDEETSAPREYLCPISLELMRDPVLLVETGQVYDRCSIESWFATGTKSCPVSRTEVKKVLLSPIFPLRSAIQAYAKEHHIEHECVGGQSTMDNALTTDSLVLSGRLFDGVSVYDVRGLVRMIDASDVEQQAIALKLLVEMWRFSDASQQAKLSRLLSKDKLGSVFQDSETEAIRNCAARLLLHLPGRYFDGQQQLKLLTHDDSVLQEEVLMRLWNYGYRHRSRMRELATFMLRNGADEIIAICRKLADPTENTDVTDEVRMHAAFLLACAAFRKTSRYKAIGQGTVPLLVNSLQSTSNLGFRFCLMKALQYMSKDSDGGNQIIRAGGIRSFVAYLPERNNSVHYYTRIYLDWFAWVTVAETAVKALYWLAFDSQGLAELKTSSTMKVLRLMVKHRTLPKACYSKYLMPLLHMLSASTS